ncbi:hypothetical protein [Sphaerisporangium dianthi]|uniref:Uncharacterized protein n=1 Tax=Sphaerisporangium dianthi TaxID=1436120 RepID=A0ABV9CUX8_9ACTN
MPSIPRRERLLVRREPLVKPVTPPAAEPVDMVAACMPAEGAVIGPGAAPEGGAGADDQAVPGRPEPPEGGTGGGAEGHAVLGWPEWPNPGGAGDAPGGDHWPPGGLCGAPGPPFGPPRADPGPAAPEAGEGRAASGTGAMPQVSQYPSTTVPEHPGCVHLVIRPLRFQ